MFLVFDNKGLPVCKRRNGKVYYSICEYGNTNYIVENKLLKLIKSGKIDNVILDNTNHINLKAMPFHLVNVTETNFIDLKKFDYNLSLTIKDYDDWLEEVEEPRIKDKRLFKGKKFAVSQDIINNYKILYYGKSIIGLVLFENHDNVYYNFNILYLLDMFDEADIIDFILKKNKKYIYISDSSRSLYEKAQLLNWKCLNFNSTIITKTSNVNEFKYSNMYSSASYYTFYDENIIVDYIESKYRQKLDYSKLKVYHCNSSRNSQLYKYYSEKMRKGEFIFWETLGNFSPRMIGFNYLTFDDLNTDMNLVVLTYNDLLIGVFKYKEYESYIGVAFFEINNFYKTIDLENYFLKLLNDYLPKNKVVQLPMDNAEERRTKLSKRMKKYINVVQVKTDDELRQERYGL